MIYDSIEFNKDILFTSCGDELQILDQPKGQINKADPNHIISTIVKQTQIPKNLQKPDCKPSLLQYLRQKLTHPINTSVTSQVKIQN